MTTNQLEISELSKPVISDGASQNFATELYGNMPEARKLQQQITSNDTTSSVLSNFGNVELFDSSASMHLKNGAGSETADRAAKIKRDDQGRPTEVDGTKFQYGPDGKVNRVDFPKGWYADGGDTLVKGSDGKWRDTKHNKVHDDFDVSVQKDGTNTITEKWGDTLHTRTKNPDGSQRLSELDGRGVLEVVDYGPDGRSKHIKVSNRDGKVWKDEDIKHYSN